jgi:general secretion pathway protein E
MMDSSHARLPFGFARRYAVMLLPPNGSERRSALYTSGIKPGTLAEVRRFAGTSVHFEEVDKDTFAANLASTYQNDSEEAMLMIEGLGDDMDLSSLADSIPETEDLMAQEDDAPIIRLINSLLSEAIKVDASDIHIETYETKLVVRFRVDGVLREIVTPKRALAPLLVSRIKVMAKLDIAEKRLPQDGRISLRVAGREVDVRVSTIPANNGERVVMRLLDKQEGRRDLSHLGMNADDLERMEQLVKSPHGVILVTGPTGSGKSTTLYACLDTLNDKSRNILTVEDPIEYDVEGVGQTQVNVKADMTFAKGLKAILRQDPDVVMVGEIRDYETADIAVQASLTGHLVLSTIHTNTALGAITRLANMGVQPYLLTSSIVGLVAQRLIRMLCNECKEAHKPSEFEREFLNIPGDQEITLYKPKGCESCSYEGFSGRLGIYEVVAVDDKLKEMIHNSTSEVQIEQYARTRSRSIREDGREKILLGVTSVDEVLRVTMED